MARVGSPRRPGTGKRAAGLSDLARVERAAHDFLTALGSHEDPRLLDGSPRRIAEAWASDLLGGYRIETDGLLDTIPAEGDEGLVLVRGIEFTSLCVHHLLPFFGQAHLGYLPGKNLTGISKLARLVDALARRLQIQERLTARLVAAMQAALRPRGAAAVLEAEHLCMTARGIRSRGATVVTASWSGRFKASAAERQAFLKLVRRGSPR